MAKGTLKISGADSFTAADLAPDSVGASELADDAVDTDAIANDAVTYVKMQNLGTANRVLGSSSTGVIGETQVALAMVAADAIDGTKIADNAVDSEHIAADSIDAEHYAAGSIDVTAIGDVVGGTPHIQLDVLHPAWDGKLLDGTTGHVNAYGTAQADGLKYYYTTIMGSKPIKDPRIGTHYGSQRHLLRNREYLPECSIANQANRQIWSVDGRDWVRAVGDQGQIETNNNANGLVGVQFNPTNVGDYIEITGYFSDVNIAPWTRVDFAESLSVYVDEFLVIDGSGTLGGDCVVSSPLSGRFQESGSMINVGLEPHISLGIHTIRFLLKTNGYFIPYAFELIAQDRTTTTGSDLAPNNCATSMGALTEADATTGWSNTNIGTFASDDTPAGGPTGVGSHSLHLTATGSGQWAGTTSAITTVAGTRYKVTMHYKMANGDVQSKWTLYVGTASGSGNIAGKATVADSQWHTETFIFTATTTTFWMLFQESGTNDDAEIYIGGISVFALSDTEFSNIQIPAQNVVSYGKKFSISAAGHHYNPFAYAADGTTAVAIANTTSHGKVSGGWSGTGATYFDSTLDTATSLGLSKWEAGGNFYRPVNGGRVVKWIDSSGNIKTSVNIIPPEAHFLTSYKEYSPAQDTSTWGGGAGNGRNSPTGTSWLTRYQPMQGTSVTGNNIVRDGTFTANVTGWTAVRCSLASVAGGQSGNCMQMTHSSGTSNYCYNEISDEITVGKTYRLDAYVKSGTSGNETFWIGVGQAGVAIHTKNVGTSSASWLQWSFTFKAATNCNNIFLYKYSGSSGTMLFDTIEITEIENPDAQTEHAKSFLWTEFGNGSANAGTTAGSWPDFSMLSALDDVAYTMDDGLTNMAAINHALNSGGHNPTLSWSNANGSYLTFIGSGIAITGATSGTNETRRTIAQNLPYGTHVIEHLEGTDYCILDGLAQFQTSALPEHYYREVHFMQPKMPPIPENAVVIADYMLMADHVPITGMSSNADVKGRVGKGVRLVNASRDHNFDSSSGHAMTLSYYQLECAQGIRAYFHASATSSKFQLPAFGTAYTHVAACGGGGSHNNVFQSVDGDKASSANIADNTKAVYGAVFHSSDDRTLDSDGTYTSAGAAGTALHMGLKNLPVGLHTYKQSTEASNGTYRVGGTEVATPIHTSSHYQTFETPYTHDLVGGDRNIEQTNLIVTPDGKTWDEVTRDTSYIGNACISSWTNTSTTWPTIIILDEWRGRGVKNQFNKDFAIAYDRVICLVDGQYQISVGFRSSANDQDLGILINGTLARDINIGTAHSGSVYAGTFGGTLNATLKRGDWVQIKGMFGFGNGEEWQWFEVERIN